MHADTQAFSGLVHPKPETRTKSAGQLMAKDASELRREILPLLLSKETKPDVAEAALLLLEKKLS